MKRIFCTFCAAVISYIFLVNTAVTRVFADENSVTADTVSIEQMLREITAEEIIVTECVTGKVLFEKNSQVKREISHLAKLMTLLIAAEKLESGEISLDDTVTVSAEANAMEGAQIWLDKGEKIRLEELIKAISIGNANDACVALAEHMGGSEAEFVKLMNKKANKLGMENTSFADSTGMSQETVSTAYDLSILAAELIKHENLKEYLTIWLDTVRDGKAELVSQNRLVRTYNGITGLKACGSKSAGECSAVTAERNGMKVAVIILGSDTSENREAAAKKLLDMSFESFQIYMPEITKDMVKKIDVKGGETDKVKVSFGEIKPVIIPRGAYSSVEIDFEKRESIEAPVLKGQKAGKLVCRLGEEVFFSADLKTCSEVKKMNFKCGFLKLMYNLLELYFLNL